MLNVSILLSLCLFMLACSSTASKNSVLPKIDHSTSLTVNEYRIGIEDQLQINVWRNPELSITMPVRPDGKISMPLIGDVLAGGRTPEEVAREITKGLEKYVRKPNVTVILTELRNFEYISRIRVTGAVQTPTSFAYRQGMTVLDAVLEAGGVTEFAAADRAKLYRQGSEKTMVYDIRLGGILHQGELATNFPLKPGDIITVPERFF
ncbi:MAG: polysaccharide biosynthesis/export family protein [Gammaproteobacteria bacterium]|nr:polysaccharide biosynthesis/export family protein [Gammaproteobacteria bacterium]